MPIKKILKVCALVLFSLLILAVGWKGFRNAHKEDVFRTDVEMCSEARRVYEIVPSNVASFCKVVDEEIERRKIQDRKGTIYYLEQRFEEEK